MIQDIQTLLLHNDLAESAQMLVLIAATFISEDATILGSSLLVASGKMLTHVFILGNFLGISLGDLLLYAIGRGVVRHKAIGKAKHLGRFQKFLHTHRALGFVVILLARAIPGTRVPVYISAGVGRYPFPLFFLATIISVGLWVYLFYLFNEQIYNLIMTNSMSLWTTAIIGLTFYFVVRKVGQALPVLFDPYKRRAIPNFFRKLRYYEFWPAWMFYFPVIFYYLYLSIRYRNPLLPSAANPSIFAGGLIGEYKGQIFAHLDPKDPAILPFTMIEETTPLRLRLKQAQDFIKARNIKFPLIMKPNSGLRGAGVTLIQDNEHLAEKISEMTYPVVLQEYAPYPYEIGLFYVKNPETGNVSVYSTTEKIFPSVTGDGKSTLGQLILADPRARLISDIYFERFQNELDKVLKDGETKRLVTSGNHAQGTIFKDGVHIASPALIERIDAILSHIPDFYAGRLDIRFKDLISFRKGKNFKIIEVNGAGSEATHIYDERLTIWEAYRTLFRQWKLMFEIGHVNRRRGKATTHPFVFLRQYFKHRNYATNYSRSS